MSKEVKKQLKELRTIVPNESWKERQRGILMSQIKNTVSDNVPEKNFKDTIMAIGEVFIPLNSIMRFARPVVASFLIVAFALGGGIATVGAAMNSVPGDALYGVKRVTEKVRLTLTPSEIEKAKLQLKFANDRLEEVNKLYKSVDPKKSAKIKVAVNDFQEGIKSMQEKIQQVKEEDANGALEAAQEIDDKADKMGLTLEETKEKLAVSSADEKNTGEDNRDISEAQEAVDSALITVNSASFDALRILVLRENTDKVKISGADINSRLKNEIEKISEGTEKAKKRFVILSGQDREYQRIQYSILSHELKDLKDKIDQSIVALGVMQSKLKIKDFVGVLEDVDYHKNLLIEIGSTLESLEEQKRLETEAALEAEENSNEEIITEEVSNENVENEEQKQDESVKENTEVQPVEENMENN